MRNGALDASAEFATEMILVLERAVEHPDMSEELAALLSTSAVEVEHRVEIGANVTDS